MSSTSESSAAMDYWMKRLDHAANHIQTSSKLVYLVDGAVLAFVYFLIDKVGASRASICWISPIFLLLAFINYLHSEFIRHMNHEYNNINKKLIELIGANSEHTWPSGNCVIKRDLYRLIHIVISLFLFIVFTLMLFYGFGCFKELILLSKGN
jgi:hypothetical protein